jgi:hypothetical protein
MIKMQTGTEFVLLSNFVTILVSASVGLYLLRLWLRQSNRLITDLPLVFAITTISQACQTAVLALPTMGLLEASMDLFRLRSVIIGGSIIPLVGALLQIWAPRIQKYHNKILGAFTLYWILIAILGSTEAIIMTLTIPLIVIAGLMMMVTFIITWRTGRLKEIRSEVMIAAIPFAMVSQILRVPLMNTSLFYVPDILLALSLAITAFAFTNPWNKKNHTTRNESGSQRELEVAAEYY